MSGVQAKEVAPIAANTSAETLLSNAQTGFTNVGQGIKKGVVSGVAAVGQGSTVAATAEDSDVQRFYSCSDVSGVQQVGGGAVEALGEGLKGITKGFLSGVTAVGQGATIAVTAVDNGVQQVGGTAVEAFNTAGESAKGAVKSLSDGIKGPLPEPKVETQVEKTWMEKISGRVRDTLHGWTHRAKAAEPIAADSSAATLLSNAQNGFTNVGQGMTKGAVDGVTAVGQGAVTAVDSGVQQVGGGAVDAFSTAGEGAKGAVNGLSHGITGPSSELQLETQVDKTWIQKVLSFDAACCICRPKPDDGRLVMVKPAETPDNMLGSIVRSLFAKIDASTLGVKVDIGALKIHASTGRIQVQGLTIRNPEGWSSEYLLHANKIVVDLDMKKLLYSFGKNLHVEELIFDGVDVIYEKGLLTSNLQDLLDNLASKAKAEPSGKVGGDTPGKESDVKIVLQTVLAQNIGAKLATSLSQGYGVRLQVGDLKYDDFDKEMGAGRGLIDIIRVLIMTLIKSVLATAVGKSNTEAIAGTANGVMDKFSTLGASLWSK